MPIKVQCACGKAFAAKDELAGKTVKCPGCQKPLKIPTAAAAPASAAKPAAAKPAPPKAAGTKPASPSKPAPARPTAAPSAPAPAPKGGDSLFDEIGLQPAEAGTKPCPGCTQPMPIDAVVCIKCGYNSIIGRRMETVKVGLGAEGGGHGAVAQDMLDKAAQVIDDDALEEKKKTGEGMPWWVYLIVLAGLIGLATFMLTRGGGETSTEKKGFIPGRRERLIVKATMERPPSTLRLHS